MNIHYTCISDTNCFCEELRNLYFESFPPDERRPWNDIIFMASKVGSPYSFYCISLDDGTLVGMISLWNLGEALYVEHLAINRQMRNMGIGGKAIDFAIAKAETLPTILEVEPAENGEMQRRRINFYNRHRFHLYGDYEYTQPPYTPHGNDVKLKLMSTKTINPDRAKQLLYQIVYNIR